MYNKGNDENELILEIINNINKNKREIIKLSAMIEDNKKQIKYKNILLIVELIIILLLMGLLIFFPISSKVNRLSVAGYGNTTIVGNNIENYSSININSKE